MFHFGQYKLRFKHVKYNPKGTLFIEQSKIYLIDNFVLNRPRVLLFGFGELYYKTKYFTIRNK